MPEVPAPFQLGYDPEYKNKLPAVYTFLAPKLTKFIAATNGGKNYMMEAIAYVGKAKLTGSCTGMTLIDKFPAEPSYPSLTPFHPPRNFHSKISYSYPLFLLLGLLIILFSASILVCKIVNDPSALLGAEQYVSRKTVQIGFYVLGVCFLASLYNFWRDFTEVMDRVIERAELEDRRRMVEEGKE
jgi:hypothetical protein